MTYDAGFKAVFADEANKCLLVRVLNYILPEEAKVQDIKKYHSLSHEKPEMWDTNELISNYVFTEKRTGEIASPTISIIFVELERFTKRLDECTSELDQLLYLFRNISSLTGIPEEMRTEPFFEKLLNACRIAAFPENKKLNYELNMMRERDIIAQREYAVQNGFNNGRKEGRAEGLEEGKKMTQIETAKNLLKAGVAPGVIAECVGLSLDFVKSL